MGALAGGHAGPPAGPGGHRGPPRVLVKAGWEPGLVTEPRAMPCPALTCVICHSRICEAGGHVPTSSQGNPGSGMETAWDWRLGDGRGDPLMPGPKPRVPALAPPAPLIRRPGALNISVTSAMDGSLCVLISKWRSRPHTRGALWRLSEPPREGDLSLFVWCMSGGTG